MQIQGVSFDFNNTTLLEGVPDPTTSRSAVPRDWVQATIATATGTAYTAISTNSTYVTVVTIPIATAKAVLVSVLFAAINTSVNAESCGGRYQGVVSNSAGTLTISGETAMIEDNVANTPSIRILISGTDVLLQVRSRSNAGTTNLNWSLFVTQIIAV